MSSQAAMVHLSRGRRDQDTACGRVLAGTYNRRNRRVVTRDRAQVTCSQCRGTLFYRDPEAA